MPCQGSLPLWSNSTISSRRTITGQSLGELGPLTNSRTFPIKDIDGDRDKECETSEDGSGPFQVVFLADVFINCAGRVSVTRGWLKTKRICKDSAGVLTGSRVHSGYASKEISSQCIATCGGGGVWPVAGNHVVDCSHVYTILERRKRFSAHIFFTTPTWAKLMGPLTFAMAMRQEKISGAIQCT